MHLSHLGFLAACAAVCGAAVAQPAGGPAYRSALQDYRRFADEPLVAWKQANDAVREAGGWRALAKEGKAPAQDAKSGETRPDAHGGHKH